MGKAILSEQADFALIFNLKSILPAKRLRWQAFLFKTYSRFEPTGENRKPA
jgi:hypothetical protein